MSPTAPHFFSGCFFRAGLAEYGKRDKQIKMMKKAIKSFDADKQIEINDVQAKIDEIKESNEKRRNRIDLLIHRQRWARCSCFQKYREPETPTMNIDMNSPV